jgi:uncharacterized membrane protein YfcA
LGVQLDLWVALAGLIVGFTVGLTGMGGGALMTPILVLVFHVEPLAAVSSDLVAAVVMKPVGGGVHLRRGTVNLNLVRWLCIGSVPCAFAGVLVLNSLGSGDELQDRIKHVLGVALLVAAFAILAKAWVQRQRGFQRVDIHTISVKRAPTIAIGALGGLIVGMTSVGSGSLIIVLLLLLYPALSASQLVGTDLVQAIPLVAAAALGHILFGDFQLAITASLLVGSIPGVYFGARLSAKAPDSVIRPALVTVLVLSGLKLIGASNTALAVALALALAGWLFTAVVTWLASRNDEPVAADGAVIELDPPGPRTADAAGR